VAEASTSAVAAVRAEASAESGQTVCRQKNPHSHTRKYCTHTHAHALRETGAGRRGVGKGEVGEWAVEASASTSLPTVVVSRLRNRSKKRSAKQSKIPFRLCSVALLLLLLAALRKINLNAISDITFSLLGMHIKKKSV